MPNSLGATAACRAQRRPSHLHHPRLEGVPRPAFDASWQGFEELTSETQLQDDIQVEHGRLEHRTVDWALS